MTSQLPTLTGTEQQIALATTILTKGIASGRKDLEFLTECYEEDLAAGRNKGLDRDKAKIDRLTALLAGVSSLETLSAGTVIGASKRGGAGVSFLDCLGADLGL